MNWTTCATSVFCGEISKRGSKMCFWRGGVIYIFLKHYFQYWKYKIDFLKHNIEEKDRGFHPNSPTFLQKARDIRMMTYFRNFAYFGDCMPILKVAFLFKGNSQKDKSFHRKARNLMQFYKNCKNKDFRKLLCFIREHYTKSLHVLCRSEIRLI